MTQLTSYMWCQMHRSSPSITGPLAGDLSLCWLICHNNWRCLLPHERHWWSSILWGSRLAHFLWVLECQVHEELNCLTMIFNSIEVGNLAHTMVLSFIFLLFASKTEYMNSWITDPILTETNSHHNCWALICSVFCPPDKISCIISYKKVLHSIKPLWFRSDVLGTIYGLL